jgi:hypothetical protein
LNPAEKVEEYEEKVEIEEPKEELKVEIEKPIE